ncbi:hypothetical protein BDEG_24918 [Batrachochytrium dendrobatidis JEL423]|uniref:Threonyl/alanyl tRNA synthetase SAD domain-containing protein n=1 Tax=Batrachochytrium dendrobatidis (strain JEL423) TaxID=403673 RepID=A0A177WNB1_BATDL|nr:hypothetical protein BDEG_24918 [Batrachochytrium dendrobatidis JEL423]
MSVTAAISTRAYIGSLLCQRDSLARTIQTVVISCVESSVSDSTDAVHSKPKMFEVVLADTVIFPTGGGQPNDLGKINGIPIVDARRVGLDCVHILNNPVEKDQVVQVDLDWDRRFDHMQQHSAQHLLSAIAQKEFDMKTVGWSLGKAVCYIEVTAEPKQHVLDALEQQVNAYIRKRIAVSVVEHDMNEHDMPKKLPSDLDGAVMLWNPCGKLGRHSVLVFQSYQSTFLRNRKLTDLLSTGPENFVERVEGLKKNIKELIKTNKKQSKEIAALEKLKLGDLGTTANASQSIAKQ